MAPDPPDPLSQLHQDVQQFETDLASRDQARGVADQDRQAAADAEGRAATSQGALDGADATLRASAAKVKADLDALTGATLPQRPPARRL